MSKVHKIAVKALTFDDLFNDQCVGGIGNRIVTCEECDKEFGNVGIFEMHLQEVHSLDALDHCEKCTNQFKRRMGLIGHLRQVHLAPLVEDDTYKRPLGCDLCDAFLVINGFTSYDELDSHTKIIHGPESFLNTPGNIGHSLCPICHSEFKYRKGMIEHVQVIHGEHLVSELLKIKGDDKDKHCESRRFKCKYCERLFTVRKSLIQHLERIHKDFGGHKSASATVNIPQSRNSLSEPVISVVPATEITPRPKRKKMSKKSPWSPDNSRTGTPLIDEPCSVCNKVFTRQSVLDMHMKMAHGSAVETIEVEPELNGLMLNQELSKDKALPPVEDPFEDPETSKEPFYTTQELEQCVSAKHHDFYPDAVPCDANAGADEEREPCLIVECDRKFLSYFSMMRHVAFFHRPAKTASLMNLRVLKRKLIVDDEDMPLLVNPRIKDEIMDNDADSLKIKKVDDDNIIIAKLQCSA